MLQGKFVFATILQSLILPTLSSESNICGNSSQIAQIYTGDFHENSCEILQNDTNSRYGNETVCMSCYMKISKVAEREQKHVYGIAYIPDEDINLKHRHKLNVTERVHCANVTNQSSCEIKPEIKIVTKNKTKTMETAEGFEIRILKYANSENRTDEVFVEVIISSSRFREFEYPDIIVDYVPGFKFKPCSKYGFTLNTLPKKSVMDGGNMRPHNFTTHGLPSLEILQAGIGSFPQWKEKPERNCSKKVSMYPDIIVDYVPGFKFKPCSKYGFTLNTLPKKSVMDGGNMRPHNFTTHGLPSLDILQAGIGSFPQWKEKPERNCSKKDCIVGVNCSEDGVENMGTVRSFLLAVAVSILFLLFFGAIVAIARVKARSLSGRDDTEFLYDDQDDDFQDEDEEHRAVRMNETEMTDVVQAPHKQQSQNGISSLANSGLAAQAGSSVYNVENNRISVQPSNAAPQGPPASSEFATSELGRD